MTTPLTSLQRGLVRALPDRVVYPLTEWRHGHQEPELRQLAELAPLGRVSVDVGAWMGPWTRALARRSSHVHAFEPQPGLAAFLRRVAAPNVTVHEAAVGTAKGAATLVTDDRPGRDALARLGQDTVEGIDPAHRIERQVEVVALDDLALEDVGFVKIDVEGHELEALAGAEGLLRTQRPTLVLEAEQRHIEHPLSDVFAAVTTHGYHGWFLFDRRWLPLDRFDVMGHQLALVDTPTAASYVNNFIFTVDARPPGASTGPRR
jgi:FkbM family methyltransferase